MPFIIFIIHLSILSVFSRADPLYTDCSSNINYRSNSEFENNLRLLLNDLSSNTSRGTPLGGFYNTFAGENQDIVYGQTLCRGDVNSTVCQNCIKDAGDRILNNCKSEDAIIWYELCQVRYSFEIIVPMQVYTGMFPETNKKKKPVKDPILFNKVLMHLMLKLSDKAAFNASNRMFATGKIKFSDEETIYGLLQCTRDISGGDCNNCFQSVFSELTECCSDRQGGTVVSENCNVRFELYQFYNEGAKLKIWEVMAVTLASALLVLIIIGSCTVYFQHLKRRQRDNKSERALLQELASPTAVTITQEGNLVTSEELPFMDLTTIRAATDDFKDSNKLGQGGFGTVYQGVLPNGEEVAVKRLSKKSWQGLEEFRNEVKLIAKLQHRNLVRLLGCGIEGEEKLLLYEFMPNRSLNFFIFDSERRSQLDWKTCYNIIGGIAKGLLYLHEDSRLKIIHRDLKPSNVLLDHEMVAKISDFGVARIFCENQNTNNTKRVVGTYGYMAPEYAMEGIFSIKSDVFSFGVILLEIISGKKNNGFHLTKQAQTLLGYAWRLWKEGKELVFVDPLLRESSSRPTDEIRRCIHIGLLCVQEDPADRPTMSSVVVFLKGSESVSLPEPRQPAFAVGRVAVPNDQSMSSTDPTINGLTISTISPR
ncbi:putative receptor-like protein kinase At4g00960 [Morus notabilis]|uniref:putative receptor-like protein kinase At4g00960 n=1 Tax=Morus notabilis TaxID=981085 RepID=UPI000CED1793|nr:putative receptor-like protein kinase At4g00960 [Morus notabilis]